jgi:hypothetical protein
MAEHAHLSFLNRFIQWTKNNSLLALLVLIVAAVIKLGDFADSIDKLERFLGFRKASVDAGPSQVTITLTGSATEVQKVISGGAASRTAVQTWRRVDSDTQQGFYQTQLAELSQKLTAAHVAPDGVKFMFGIGRDEPHRGWMSVFVREGDNKPFVYQVTEEKNNGQAGAVQAEIINKLKDGAVIPIGWTYGSESFIYATAKLD